MFDRYSDFALNKLDRDAIVCKSVTGDPIRLTRESFATEEEFKQWKAWSDADYHKIQKAGRQDDDCLSLDEQLDAPVLSAEEVLLAPILQAEQAGQRSILVEQIRKGLTKTQYRRLLMACVQKIPISTIALTEGVAEPSVSESVAKARKKVLKIFQKNPINCP